MGQVLSQEEVDALLRGVSDGEIETESEEVVDPSGVIPYDLTSQERIIRGRMPTLEIINQRFARLFRTSISAALRRVVDVSPISTDMVKFGEFLKTLPVPTSLNVFRLDPLRGFGLMVLETKLVFSLIDIFFGGSGRPSMKIEGRDFTPIEHRIIKNVVTMALQDMENSWVPVHPIKIAYVRTEINPQFVGIVPPTDVVVVISFEMETDQSTAAMIICIPYSTIEPIRAKLQAGFQSDRLEIDRTWIARVKEQLEEAQVNLVVELGRTSIKAQEVLKLRVGDVIPLDSDASEDLLVKVEGIPKFRGRPGVFRGNKALKVSSRIERHLGGSSHA
ncbi:MAG: flagellar motor switch protein FliM [Candidatus Tectomicrobia bacterium]|uniref:Flagellar motor switch protein FliM n=1 Tax=Tectimicrobiota bacterium TaxID=2528274 RepID=A0A932GN48_UNCTE|nr:flagellar motor switch protein FliM [Candidatus Tectomicrobia bacterium]